MTNFIEAKFGKQIVAKNEDEVISLINSAKNKNQMNQLRTVAASYLETDRGREILELWQKKYWSLVTCPCCGRVRE